MTPLERCAAEQQACGEYLRGDGPDKAGALLGAADWLAEEAIIRASNGDYHSFLDRKMQAGSMGGFEPLWMPDFLFDFQRALVEWAIRKGRAAIFADCLSEEAVIHSPDGDTTIGDACKAGKPIRIYSLDDGTPCVKTASAPFISGVGRLYRYSLASGRSVIASKRHRFLTPSGWKRGGEMKPGDALLVSDASHLRSSLGPCPSAHIGDGPNSGGTIQDSQPRYAACPHPGGEPPPQEVGIASGLIPSRGGVLERSQPNSHTDGSDDTGEYTRQNQPDGHHAIAHSDLQVGTTQEAGGCPPPSFDPSCSHGSSRTSRLVAGGSIQIVPRGELPPSEEPQNAGDQFSTSGDLLIVDTLLTIQYIRFDVYFDMEVEGTECFLAEGVWSHNCGLGKTPMQLVWAENVVRKVNRPVLILTPLAVGPQTVLEGKKFGIHVTRSRDGKHSGGIVITNYEKLHHFNPEDFAGVVCDESSILKHFSGATQSAVTRFMLKIPYRLLCTATAAPNDYIELGTASEALGELGYSDMLTRFFKQTDNKPHRMQEIKEWRAARQPDGNHFGKLSYRVHQSIGQWRLKGHAVLPFWRWVSSWARAIRQPSDFGFDDRLFVLPPLIEQEHIVEPHTPPDGMLFTIPAFGLREERDERRRTLDERCELVARLVDHDRPAVVWCHLNVEGDRLEKGIPGSIQVKGAMSDEAKEEAYARFRSGDARVIVIKPKIGAWGLNWEFCNHVVTFASHSYEQFYQSIRRCWRFGQTRPVTVDIISTTGEQHVRENMARKSEACSVMFRELVGCMPSAMNVPVRAEDKERIEVPSWE